MDFSKLIARVKGILLTPKTEWPVIAAEPASVADIYKNYIVVLAAVPVVLGFIKSSIIGFGVPFHGTIRVGIGAGLGAMVVSYVLALIQVYLMALIVDALAPRFGGEKNQIQALKVVAYSFTASWVAGIGQIVPWVAWLIMLAGLIYTVYLLYLGLPQTMKCPPQRAVGYTAVSIIIAIVLGWVIALVVAGITGTGAMMTHMGGHTTSSSIDVEFDKDSPLGKLDDWTSKVEEASKKMEAAQESGDAEAQSAAMGRMMGAVLGGDGEVEALAPDRLKLFVPESIGDLKRAELSVERNSAMGMQISEARATYSDDSGRSLRLEITDMGAARGVMALAGWASVKTERELKALKNHGVKGG